MAHVQTVRGPIDPADLGRVMTHEHLLSLVPGPWLSGGNGDHRADLAVDSVRELPRLGFGTVVDLTPYDIIGKDVTVLPEISERSGLHIVAGSSIYLEPYSPSWALQATVDEMTSRFVRDAVEGVDETGIKIGIYGEQATGLNEITPHEEKCLRAAARAHRVTGLSINTHTTHGTMALEQVEIMREEKVDLSRVIIGHMDIQPDVDYTREVLRTGVNIAFDTIGKQFWDFVLEPLPADPPEGEFGKRAYYRPDAVRVAVLAQLVRDGFAGQIVLSQDMTGAEAYLNGTTHGQLGYSYLGEQILPQLREAGVSEEELDQLLVRNPARLLTID
jgi:predicted metal-dependent phosphotriesterase family hydrolase